MSRTIWKFPLDVLDEQIISMPRHAEILSVACQNDALVMWAKVDPENSLRQHKIHIRGTGHPLDEEEGRFIGTVLMAGGSLVWHVFSYELEMDP